MGMESRRSPLSPDNSARPSPGQAQAYSALRLQPLIAGIEEDGVKGGPWRVGGGQDGRSDESPPLRRWNRRQGEEGLVPGAHQAAPPARYLVLELASSPDPVSAPPP